MLPLFAPALQPFVLQFYDDGPSTRANALQDRINRVIQADILCPSIFVNDPCSPCLRRTEEICDSLVLVSLPQLFEAKTMRRTIAQSPFGGYI
jgi:hypothetical protein